jgi:hypothetical protein
MILSPAHQLAMLLPWKTASQTLRSRLQAINQSPYTENFHLNTTLHRVVHQHLVLADFLKLPENKPGMKLAVFVRNPYDRVYSGFMQLMRDVASQPKWVFEAPWIGALVRQQLSENFESLCKAQFNVNRWFLSLPEYAFHDVGRNSSLPLYPAHFWTHSDGQLRAAFIGKVENFEADFVKLTEQFNILDFGHEDANRSQVKTTPDARNYHYVQKLGARTIARINDVFAADFAYFGYDKIKP